MSNVKANSFTLETLKYYVLPERFLSIDIGTNTAKVLDVKRFGTTFRIEKAFSIPGMHKYFNGRIMSNRKGLVNNIVMALKKEDIPTKKIYMNFSSNNSKAKLVTLPNVNKKEFKSFMDIEFQKEFPNSNPSQNVMDYAEVGETLNKDREVEKMFLMAIASASEVSDLINEFKLNKYYVQVVDTDINVLRNLCSLSLTENGRNLAILELGTHFSKILFTNKNVPIFSREIEYGTLKAVRAIQSKTGTTTEEAEKVLYQYGLQTNEFVKMPLSSSITKEAYNETLKNNFSTGLNEVYRSIQYVQSNLDTKPEELILIGGMSNLDGITALTENTFDMPIRIWEMGINETIPLPNGFKIINDSFVTIDASFAQCFGMAVRKVIT